MTQRNLITMSRLGKTAQWGNQVTQYAFLRTYAAEQGCDYAVPPWVGQYLFGFQDPPLPAKLPRYVEERNRPGNNGFGINIPPTGDEWVGVDWWGYGQYDTIYYRDRRPTIQALYGNPIDPQASRVQPALTRLRERGETLIGLHLRRGDSGRQIYPFTPILWCLRWLHHNWARFTAPVLFVATEDAELIPHFAGYGPVTAEDLGIAMSPEVYPLYTYPFPVESRKTRSIDFFPDWYLLQHCDVLLCSDSSFSFTAAWTSMTVTETWRMRLSRGGFERIDPYNCHFCNREQLIQYAHIPGISIDANPGYGWDGYKQRVKAIPEDPATWDPYRKPA